MIQRIQSVFLVLIIAIVATLCGMQTLHLIYVEPATPTTEYVLNLFYFNKIENGILVASQMQYLLILLASIVIGLCLYILLNFKNRLKQMQFTQINLFAMLVLLAAFAIKTYTFVPNFSSEKLMLSSLFGISLFLFMVYLNIRVFFLIKKDEELVRSADRIR